MSETALQFTSGVMSFEEWASIGRTLQRAAGSVNWWLGDWLNEGEIRYGEMYTQAIEETGLSYQTLANIKYVSGRIPASHRRENLPWKHHAIVASLPDDERDFWLSCAIEDRLSASRLQTVIRDAKRIPAVTTHNPALDAEAALAAVITSNGYGYASVPRGMSHYIHMGPLTTHEKQAARTVTQHIMGRVDCMDRRESVSFTRRDRCRSYVDGLLDGVSAATPDWGRDLPGVIRRYHRRFEDRLTHR
jgi:hypothetical protein